MAIKDLMPWSKRGGALARREGDDPIIALQRDMNRLFEDFWKRFETAPFAATGGDFTGPRADVAETDKAIEVTVELPGMDEKDIEVSLADDVLTVKGEKKAEREEKQKGYHLSERSFGSFYRSIPLPAGVATDKISAEFRKGVLTVTMPKTPEAAARTKRIAVKGA